MNTKDTRKPHRLGGLELPRPGKFLQGTTGGAYVLVVPARTGDGFLLVDADRETVLVCTNAKMTRKMCVALWPSMQWQSGRPRSGSMDRLYRFIEDRMAETPTTATLILPGQPAIGIY